MTPPQTRWMIDPNDPARLEIVARAQRLGITGDPDKASHALGTITLANGKSVQAHVIHAADAVITDGKTVAMIRRKNDPGAGKPALPGGFIDPTAQGNAESVVRAAVREALEEAGIELGEGIRIGARNMNRPYDVRIATSDGLLQSYGVKAGDVFMVSTQAIRFDVADLKPEDLIAGDDAEPDSAHPVEINKITRDYVGIPDHADMVHQALAARKQTPSGWTLPKPG